MIVRTKKKQQIEGINQNEFTDISYNYKVKTIAALTNWNHNS